MTEEKKRTDTLTVKGAAFLSALIVGYMVHVFAFTNLIPNCDGLSRLYDRQNMLMSGRWFLHAASLFHGFVEAPALIGALSLIFLGLSAAVITDLLKIRSIWGGILTGSFLTANLVLAYTYTFTFTASAYAFAILLAVLSVWFTVKFRRAGWLAGAVILAFSLGIYQSYLALALSLAVIAFIFNLFDSMRKKGASVKADSPWRLFVRFVLLFGLGSGFYLLILQVSLRLAGISLSNYRGMNSFSENLSGVGLISLAEKVFLDACKSLFTNRIVKLHSGFWVVLNVLFLVVILAGLVRMVMVSHLYRKPGRIIWMILALAFFPFALNFSTFLNTSSLWMRYSFTAYYLFALVLMERCARKKRTSFENAEDTKQKSAREYGIERNRLRRLVIPTVLCGLMLLFQAQYSNTVYTVLNNAHTATQSFLTVLTARIQSMPGYQKDMNVIIIGTPSEDLYKNSVPEFQLISSTASPADTVLYETKHIYYYLNDWMNVNWEEPSEETFKEVSDSRVFQQMPLYPDDGSIVISGNDVIVRLSERYTPKKQFELDFEKTQQR